MAKPPIQTEPAAVEAVDGSVILECHDSGQTVMSPAAAEETSERLLEGAMKARGQAYFAHNGD